MSPQTIAEALDGSKSGGGWLAKCPAHEDQNPSLSINSGTDGKIVVHCHAGCSQADVISALETKGLWQQAKPGEKIVSIYEYVDENSAHLFEVVRYEPKRFLQRTRKSSGGYDWTIKNIRLVPFRLPQLLKAVELRDLIFICEGEKDVLALSEIGIVATCNNGGAGKWKKEHSQFLRGANVIILPDNDDAGRDHARKVANSLRELVNSIKILELPGLPIKGDVSDWIIAGGNKTILLELVSGAADLEQFLKGYRSEKSSSNPEKNSFIQASTIVTEPVYWLWPPYLPLRKVTSLEGDPGLGKSQISLSFAAAVSGGPKIPSWQSSEPGNVVIFSSEDGKEDTIKPRLERFGANLDKIFIFDEYAVVDENFVETFKERLLNISPRLIIFDPIASYLSNAIDINKTNQVRQVMNRFHQLAKLLNCSVLIIRHLTKSPQVKAIYKGQGSIDFTAACRSVLLVGSDPQNKQGRVLLHIKSNLAQSGVTQGFAIRPDAPVHWTGPSQLTETDVLRPDHIGGTKSASLEGAEEFLLELLKDGAVEATEVFKQGDIQKIKERTIYRAKKSLGVKSEKAATMWYWHLPEEKQDCHHSGTNGLAMLPKIDKTDGDRGVGGE